MKKQLLLGALVAAGALCLPDVSTGHGGTYRGPGDTVPPGGGGGGGGAGGPSSPGPSGPSAPGPGGPSSPGPSSPGAPATGPAASGPTSGGGAIGPDLSIWDFWWGFNKEPYLNLRARVRSAGVVSSSDDFFLGRGEEDQRESSLRPSESLIRETVVPALLKALETEKQNDIVTGCLVALAKIGDVPTEDGSSEFVTVMTSFLKAAEQEISETAALSLGILADDRGVPTLVSLMRSDDEGQRLVSKAVPFRTRAFAAYGLGLVGNKTANNEMRQTIVEHLLDTILGERGAQPDLKVGATSALGLIPLDWESEAAATEEESNAGTAANRVELLRWLITRMDPDTRGDKGGDKDFRVRAQVPLAAARLLSSHDEIPESQLGVRDEVVQRLLELVDQNSKEKRVEVLQSATIALGMIGNAGQAGEEGKQNEAIFKELARIAKQSADNQTEFFALIALGEMGSRPGSGGNRDLQDSCEKEILTALARGKGQKQPWAALALGVYGNALVENGSTVPPKVLLAVRNEAKKEKAPALIGGYAIALGLLKDSESSDELLKMLDKKEFSTDEARGNIAVGLGLMEATQAVDRLNDTVKKAKFRPDLLQQAAIALGLLGDKSSVADLVVMLQEAKGLSAQAAIASALGFIGDKNSVEPLTAMLSGTSERKATDVARGFAAVALGIVCDKEAFPWNTKLSRNVNYRANVSTLTNTNGTGILDIL
ncbi:MAG: HEAT repeat protein [Planctomycetota bacterium]|jgi:HEAT repeat protein